MKKNIITISREFGSGGRTIGKLLAKELGYEFYDKEIIEKIAEESGLSKKYIEENAEHAPTKNSFAYAFVGRGINGMSVDDYLWSIQYNMILEVAKKGNCVIVGRCADYILKDWENAFHVFIHAEKEKRMERIVSEYGESEHKPEKRLKDKDKKRAINYKYYTDRTWGKTQNYNMCLNSGSFGIEKCVEIIKGCVAE